MILSKLLEYKTSNNFVKALELIALTEKHVQSDDLNFYKEYFNTQKAIADVVKFDYNHGPFTLYKKYSSGRVMYTTLVETFNITSAEIVRDGDLKLVCDITGITDWAFCSFKMKCYNSNGFLIDSVSISASVSKNEPFKIKDEIYIPYDTVKVEFDAD